MCSIGLGRGAGTPRRTLGGAAVEDGVDSLDGMSDGGDDGGSRGWFLWPRSLAAGAGVVVLAGLSAAIVFLAKGAVGLAAGCVLGVLAFAVLVGLVLLWQAVCCSRDEGDGYFEEHDEEEEDEDDDEEDDEEGMLASSSMTI